MGDLHTLAGYVLVGFAIFVVIRLFVYGPGLMLQQKFGALGTLAGKTRAEIVEKVGPPNSVSAAADGKTLLQWQSSSYHIALLFNGEVCEGVTHEHQSQ